MALFSNSTWESKGIVNKMLIPFMLVVKLLVLVELELHMLILGWITVNSHAVPAYIHIDGMRPDKALFVLTLLEKKVSQLETVG